MKTFLSVLALFSSLAVAAQDPVFSQFYANKPLLNPALTALDEGTAVTLNHRNLWRRVPGGFQTFAAAVETQWANCARGKLHAPFFNFGFGLVALHDEEGQGLLQTDQAQLTASAYHSIAENAAWHVGLGIGGGRKSLNRELLFADQLDAIDGQILDQSGVPIAFEPRSFADFSVGAALRFGHKFFGEEAFQSAGFSVRHVLAPPLESLDPNGSAILPAVFNFHYGSQLPVWRDHEGSKKYIAYWSPQIQLMKQGNFGVIGYGFTGLYRGLAGGVFLRHPVALNLSGNTNAPRSGGHTQTIMFTGGFEIPFSKNGLLRLDYSYDLNAGGLASRGGGAHEVSLRFNFFNLAPGGCKGVVSGHNGRRVRCPKPGGSLSRRI